METTGIADSVGTTSLKEHNTGPSSALGDPHHPDQDPTQGMRLKQDAGALARRWRIPGGIREEQFAALGDHARPTPKVIRLVGLNRAVRGSVAIGISSFYALGSGATTA